VSMVRFQAYGCDCRMCSLLQQSSSSSGLVAVTVACFCAQQAAVEFYQQGACGSRAVLTRCLFALAHVGFGEPAGTVKHIKVLQDKQHAAIGSLTIPAATDADGIRMVTPTAATAAGSTAAAQGVHRQSSTGADAAAAQGGLPASNSAGSLTAVAAAAAASAGGAGEQQQPPRRTASANNLSGGGADARGAVQQ
jgi:hypothetical protein